MAFKTGDLISMNDIINGYISNVYNPIIQNAYHYDNQPPKDGVYNLIEPERLGKLSQLQSSVNKNLNNMGSNGGLINARTMVNMMVECTRLLTKVGTWSYIRGYEENKIIYTRDYHGNYFTDDYGEYGSSGIRYQYVARGDMDDNSGLYIYKSPKTVVPKVSKNGKALFSDSYIKSLSRNPSSSVSPSSGNLIPITGLNNFFKELLSIWQSTPKYANSIVITLCHSDCYSNCHSNCNCYDCYKDK